MIKSNRLRNGILTAVICSLTAPLAVAKSHQSHKASKKVVVVKPIYRPIYKTPVHRSYHRHKVPKYASYIILAGVSYAIIDNMYYKRSGDTYVYVEQPPVTATTEVITSTTVEVASRQVGTVVDALPLDTVPVSIQGATFYVKQSEWYAPIAGTNKFVIVEAQL
ncbi:hypothetical protein [Vibrio maerlii]|uniref:hypothetical protein n=1 Tax=Vibrio maerlii TaxID=2231648 RepID=UPI000E3D1F0B|nr:hypothetical protein [Vibrio maerlii]